MLKAILFPQAQKFVPWGKYHKLIDALMWYNTFLNNIYIKKNFLPTFLFLQECNVKRIELQYPSSTEPKSSSESKADVTPQTIDELDAEGDMEQVTQLLSQLSKMRSQCTRDERRITELEEQLSTLVQQNQSLENQVIQLSHKGDDLNMKSMHEELTSLEEVR